MNPPLRPDDERGHAVLVVGGTGEARTRWLDDAIDAVQRSDASPLVVRVHRGALPLDEAIAAAAEDALRALRAPGGLYDDPGGGPFSSLGGWLFRARSVGRRGVLLVLEDLDAWLDARGASVASPAGDVLVRALEERTRRAMTVLASARAADASGGAALPSELLASFEHTVALGGARTVQRDPAVLLPHLAGRSFTLGALRNAMAGWLEVPEGDDDTVIVFSAPLAPPHIGLLPDPDPFDWPEPTRAVRDEAPAESTAGPPPLGDGWADALRAAMEVRNALAQLPQGEGKHGWRQLERAFRGGIARLPTALEALERGERALGIEATRLSRAGRAALERFERAFSDVYADAYATWLAGAPRATMLCDLPSHLARVATERNARGTALVLLSGFRYDLWLRMRSRVLPRVPGLQLLEEGVHWSARPTTPAMQRELLARGLSALGAELPPRDEPPPPGNLETALRPRREHLGRNEVLRVDAYAAEILPSREPLALAAQPVEQRLPAALLSLCGTFAGRTVVALAGDVGLREIEGEGSRFRYGGDSPFEAIVPYAVMLWG